MSETKAPEPKTFETQQYRVVGAGAVCQKVTHTVSPEGEHREVLIPTLAVRGEVVDLPAFEAKRLLALSAVKPVDEPLSYDEMGDADLESLVAARHLEVRGTAADGTVRREDRINALTIHDQGLSVSGVASDPQPHEGGGDGDPRTH